MGGAKGPRSQEDGGGAAVLFVSGGCCRRGRCECVRASMREKWAAGPGGAQAGDAMALKLLFWELEKHLKR